MKLRALVTAQLAALVSAVVLADVPLTDPGELVGTWKLEAVAAALDKPRIQENRTWEFRRDGTIVTSGYNRHFKTEDRHEWKYRIVDGKIVTDDPGRPGKTIDYSVYKKEGNELILKGGLEGFYFFRKQ
ncbi:hypothetical protein [Candidatus Methylocalor cossyra]|uniref:Lipocalin-like domain-containing protein n=1 Tax=Candidatus Methylocalor cossyra TaxID=3108543 RepID=A0ABP1C6Z1_9GAMM